VKRPLEALKRARPLDRERIDRFVASHQFPLVDEGGVTFVYRGQADAVRLQHWVFGLPTSQTLERVDDTDLWYLRLDLPESSRIEYKFDVIRNGENHWILDPLNPHQAADPFGANSVCRSYGYLRPDWTLPQPGVAQGRIEQVEIASAAFGGTRLVEVYLPARFRPTRRYPLLIVHDGLDFRRFGSLQPVLDNLLYRLEVLPLIAVLIQSQDRLTEYAADVRHARFLAEDLVPALEDRYPLMGDAGSRGLLGASLGAVASLHAAWRYPGFYGMLMLLSGSFVFTDIGHHGRDTKLDPVARFVNAFRKRPGPGAQRTYVSCGIYESLIYENRSLVPFLQKQGMEVRYEEARDGHNWENWRDRLREGLSWLFPGPLWMVYE
jgi:enterochelin esterase family protein